MPVLQYIVPYGVLLPRISKSSHLNKKCHFVFSWFFFEGGGGLQINTIANRGKRYTEVSIHIHLWTNTNKIFLNIVDINGGKSDIYKISKQGLVWSKWVILTNFGPKTMQKCILRSTWGSDPVYLEQHLSLVKKSILYEVGGTPLQKLSLNFM